MEENNNQAQNAPNQNNVTPIKVLLIEDETFISELYVRALKNNGYDAKVIIDGEEGLREAKSNQYDIILLDIMLPNKMGNDILQEIRDSKDPLRSKIIITTNLEMSDEDRVKIETQADGYLVKADITPKELVEFLNQLNIGE